MLVMFDPSTLPMTISEAPVVTETKAETSSGKLVPNPIIRIPITKGGILKNVPTSSADIIKRSDDLIKTARLTRKIAVHTHTLIVKQYSSEAHFMQLCSQLIDQCFTIRSI